jgi:AraC-like DNA-binding protein
MKSITEKSRGILNPKAINSKFWVAKYETSADVGVFVENYWTVRWDLRGQAPHQQETLPYPCVHVAIQQGHSGVFGIETGKFSRLLEGQGWVFGIKFRPAGFYPFVKTSVSAFTNKVIGLRQMFGEAGETLETSMLALSDEEEMLALAEDFLYQRLPERDETAEQINAIVDTIEAHPSITKVDDVVERFHLNKRTLQRLFSQYVGVTPKWVIMRARLHEAAEKLAENAVNAPNWPRLAQELGYFDQAHFIKDFKTIVGKTPAEYIKHIS